MGKDNLNIRLLLIAISGILALSFACQPEIIDGGDDDDILYDQNKGVITFNFTLPVSKVPVEKVHRIDMSVAKDAFSLYSGYFLESANVSDLISTYSFTLKEGEYYYQAGITCSCAGDTCLWGGFPGGQWGTKWTSGKIEVVKGETVYKNLIFSN